MKAYLHKLVKGYKELHWYEQSIFILFVLRCVLFIIVPNKKLPQFEDYTYDAAIWHILTATIELNIVYTFYKRCNNIFTMFLCFIGVGYAIDKFTEAAITHTVSAYTWVIICIIYVYTVWKKKPK